MEGKIEIPREVRSKMDAVSALSDPAGDIVTVELSDGGAIVVLGDEIVIYSRDEVDEMERDYKSVLLREGGVDYDNR